MLGSGSMRLYGSAWLVLVLVLALGACGDDDGPQSTEGDGSVAGSGMDASPGDSGAGGSAGRGGAGGSSGTGGTGGAPDAGEPYQCTPTEPTPDPGGNGDEGDACCGGLGVCTANVSGPGTEAYGHDTCSASAELACVPLEQDLDDAGVDDDAGAGEVLPACRMMIAGGADFEGRCIPSCFLGGSPSTASLEQGTCAAANTCVPCYSPITGESTGACNRPGDAPVDPAPAGFAECGDADTGYCVPGGASGSGANLPQLTCADGQVCAPKSRVLDQGSCFERCDSGIGPGACVARFIVGDQASLLQMTTCAEGELCVPCINPLNQMRTGACD